MQQDYNALTYKNKYKRAIKTALVTLLICIVVLAPTLWIWDQSIQERQTLREAKNVATNMNYLGIEYIGLGRDIADIDRESGMTKGFEEEVTSYSGAEGVVHLVSWNTTKNCVAAMSYQKGRFLVQYQYDAKEDAGTWTIYRKLHQYDN